MMVGGCGWLFGGLFRLFGGVDYYEGGLFGGWLLGDYLVNYLD